MSAQIIDKAPSRIDVSWRPPLDPKIHGHGPLIDRGGWIYRIFRDGKLIGSGSARGTDAPDKVASHAQGLADAKGLHNLPVVILSRP